jgi:nicotinamidase-related amidase
MDLRSLVAPATTAVLTMEVQEAVVGEHALLGALAEEISRVGMLDAIRRVCAGARAAGARVVHCTATSRPDGAGRTVNTRISALAARQRKELGHYPTELGTPGVELAEGLLDPSDIVVPRLHGMTPFTGTSLDAILRSLGITSVVVTGVSLNVGVFGMALSASDLGYQTLLIRDAVAGVPHDYGEAVIEHSLSMFTTVVTSDELLEVWRDK